MFTILGIDDCKWCDKAKELIDSGAIRGTYEKKTREEMRALGYTTAPAVLFLGQYFGGYKELEANQHKIHSFLFSVLLACGVEKWDGYADALSLAKEISIESTKAENL